MVRERQIRYCRKGGYGVGTPDKSQQMKMLQKLLADRFSLRFHREEKERSIYALVVQNSGSKLTPNTGDPNGPAPAGMSRQPGYWHFTATNMSMENFALGLTGNVLDRPAIDRTGLSGRYDITLDWTPIEIQPPGLDVKTFPDLFTAIKDQLGLKLESTRGLIESFVIDHVEKVSEN